MPETIRHGRTAGLDLIRGLAIALVLLRQAWPSTFAGGGIVGVVMFFALSGYLITGLLLPTSVASGGCGTAVSIAIARCDSCPRWCSCWVLWAWSRWLSTLRATRPTSAGACSSASSADGDRDG